MLAEIGYTALAVDMYGNGKTANHPKKAGEFMNAAFKDWETSKARFNKAKEVLQSHKTVDPERIGAIGFCFGGAVSIRMARGGTDLDGIVAFHSSLPLERELCVSRKKQKSEITPSCPEGVIRGYAKVSFGTGGHKYEGLRPGH